MANALVLSGRNDFFARRVLVPALQAGVDNRKIGGVIAVTSPEALERDLRLFDVALVCGSAPISLVRALVATGICYALVVDETAALSDVSEESLEDDERLRGASIVLGCGCDLMQELCSAVCSHSVDCKDLLDFLLPPLRGDVQAEHFLVIRSPGEREDRLSAVRKGVGKAGSRMHMTTPQAVTAGDGAITSFLDTYPRAAIRIVEPASTSRANLSARLSALSAGLTALATHGRPRDIARVSDGDLDARGFAALVKGQGDQAFSGEAFSTYLTSDLIPTLCKGWSASGVELAMLAAVGRLKAPSGFLPRLRRPATFSIHPPTLPGPPTEGQPAHVESHVSRWLPALATGLPDGQDGRAWRAELAAQARRLEQFAQEWGLLGLDHPSLAHAGRAAANDRLPWLEAELRGARELAEERLASIVAMDHLIKERDETIRWQGETLVERWDTIVALQGALATGDA